jgi:membrane protein implicated in regulation of membrane protease activity
MTWESFYLICFIVGFLLSVVSFFGQMFDLHLPGAADQGGGDISVPVGDHAGDFSAGAHAGDVHAGAGGHTDASGGQSDHVVSKLNFSTITAFLAWFGGTGYLLSRYASIWIWLAFALASLSGVTGAAAVFWVLAKLMAHDRTLDPADYNMVGVLGSVTSPVRAGGIGEMVFTQDGVRHSAPARSESGRAIARGTEVVVTRYERGVAYVRRWDELTGDAQDSTPKTAGL